MSLVYMCLIIVSSHVLSAFIIYKCIHENTSFEALVRIPAALRDWSIITGWVSTNREGGGQVKSYPYEKGEGGKSFSHGEGGGGQQVLG